MEIIGNIKTANKFVIYKDDGSIEWVPLLSTAKEYVNNPNNINWYNKIIYATYEDITKLSDGRLFLKSQAPIEKIKVNNYTLFYTQTQSYIENLLFEFIKKYNSTSIVEMISWKNSSIKEKANNAKLALNYRDNLYKYFYNFLKKNEEFLKSSEEPLDLSKLYDKFINNIPKLEN